VDNASDGGHARDVVRKIVADTLEIQGAYNPEEVIYDAILDANGTTMEATIVQHLGTSSLPREAPS
jgi:hypothetical protein